MSTSTAERVDVEIQADTRKKLRTRKNSGDTDSVLSYVSSTVSNNANGGNSEGQASPASTTSKKGRRGGAKKAKELGQIEEELSISTPTTPRALTRIRRNSKSDETESIVLEESSQNVTELTESALEVVCPPTPSQSTSAIGSVQSPVVVKQESQDPSGKGGGGGRKPNRRPRQKKDKPEVTKGGVTYDDLDFHSPWYASMFDASAAPQLFGPYLDVPAGVEELPNMPPNFLSRELMLQLTCNINNGLTYVGHAFESARLGAQELYNAKLTLERIYQNQHRNVDNETNRSATGVSRGSGGSSDRTENIFERSNSSNATTESLLLDVDPYQYIPVSDSSGNLSGGGDLFKDVQNAVISGRGQRRKYDEGLEGDGVTTKKRRVGRKPKIVFSSYYNSDLAKAEIPTLVEHLKANDAQMSKYEDSPSKRLVIVNFTDIGPILEKMKCTRPNEYSSRKVVTACKRKKAPRRPISKSKLGSTLEKDSAHTKDINIDEKSLPQWRKLRAPSELMNRIKERVHSGSEATSSATPSPDETPNDSVFIAPTDTNNNPDSIKSPATPISIPVPSADSESDVSDTDLTPASSNLVMKSSPEIQANNTESSSKPYRTIHTTDFKLAECEEKKTSVVEDQPPPHFEESDTDEEQDSRTQKVFLPQLDMSPGKNSGYNDAKLEASTVNGNGNNMLHDYDYPDDDSSCLSLELFTPIQQNFPVP